MSDTQVAERPAEVSNDGPDDLFHIAANKTEDDRARRGLPWRTLCGQRRPPPTASHDPEVELPDDCCVCLSLAGEL